MSWLFLELELAVAVLLWQKPEGWVGSQGIFGITKMLSVAAQLAVSAQSSYGVCCFISYSVLNLVFLVSNRNLLLTSPVYSHKLGYTIKTYFSY